MNIQDKIQEIHRKFGVTEKANYEIQLFVDELIKKDRAEQLILHGVSQQRELLVWLQKSDLVTFPKDEINEVIDDYRFYQTNCG